MSADGGWRQLSERTAYRGRLHIVSRQYVLPDGAETDYEVMVAPEVACIVALTVDGSVVLARQYRPGPGEWLMELPGGVVDPGESPADAAARELLEETGHAAGSLQAVGTTLQAGMSTMRKHVFAAVDCVVVGPPALDEHEFIEPVLVSLEEFRSHLRGGRLTDVAAGYMALDALRLL